MGNRQLAYTRARETMRTLLTFLAFCGLAVSVSADANPEFLLVCAHSEHDGKVRSQIVGKINNRVFPVTQKNDEWKSVLFMPPGEVSLFFLDDSGGNLNFGYAYFNDRQLELRRMDNIDLESLFKILSGDQKQMKSLLLEFKDRGGRTLLESSKAIHLNPDAPR